MLSSKKFAILEKMIIIFVEYNSKKIEVFRFKRILME